MSENTPTIPVEGVSAQSEVTYPSTTGTTTSLEIPSTPTTQDVFLDQIFGTLPRVTSIPTWSPKTFKASFAIDTTNDIFYFYDFVDGDWIAAAATDAHIRSLFSASSPLSYNSGTGAFTTSFTTSSTDTLTNKRITRRVVATTQSATPTINTDNTDVSYITGLAQAITSFTTNLSGTPVNGDSLIISITDNGTARAITWGSSFESSTVALPSTTVTSARLDSGFLWNIATSKWRCVAVS